MNFWKLSIFRIKCYLQFQIILTGSSRWNVSPCHGSGYFTGIWLIRAIFPLLVFLFETFFKYFRFTELDVFIIHWFRSSIVECLITLLKNSLQKCSNKPSISFHVGFHYHVSEEKTTNSIIRFDSFCTNASLKWKYSMKTFRCS